MLPRLRYERATSTEPARSATAIDASRSASPHPGGDPEVDIGLGRGLRIARGQERVAGLHEQLLALALGERPGPAEAEQELRTLGRLVRRELEGGAVEAGRRREGVERGSA